MKFVETHNHLTGWSPDAKQTFEELEAISIERGLHGFAISDHHDLDVFATEKNLWEVDVPSYIETYYDRRRMPSKRNVGDKPGFLLSLEFGWTPDNGAQLRELDEQHPFDYTIVAVHFYDGLDPYFHREEIYTEAFGEFYPRIVDMIEQSARELSCSRIVAHYDFFSRYAPQVKSKILYRHAPDSFDRLFRTMRANEQVLEINTGTISALIKHKGYTLQDAMPDPLILNRYRELGGRFLTVASDAHRVEQNGRYVMETIAYLNSLGFEEFAWFEERELHFSRIVL
jgi:histidinol-phosphatase (PHP family)